MKAAQRNDKYNINKFLIRKHRGKKEVTLFFLVLREKKCQPRILCPVEILFRKEAQIFLDKGKLLEFVI